MNTWNPNTPLSLKLELAPRPEKGRLASPMKTLDFSTDQCCHIIVVNSCEVHRFSGTDGMMRMICQGTCSLSCTSWKAYEPKEKNGCYMLIGRNLVSIIWYHLVSSGIIWSWFRRCPTPRCINKIYYTCSGLQFVKQSLAWGHMALHRLVSPKLTQPWKTPSMRWKYIDDHSSMRAFASSAQWPKGEW